MRENTDQNNSEYRHFSRSATFLNTETRFETFQESGKQDSFRHILKSTHSKYESSNSHFIRSTTRIQSETEAFDESRLVMNFLTILEVTEISCNFRLVLEVKAGKVIPEFSRLEFYPMQKTTPQGP